MKQLQDKPSYSMESLARERLEAYVLKKIAIYRVGGLSSDDAAWEFFTFLLKQAEKHQVSTTSIRYKFTTAYTKDAAAVEKALEEERKQANAKQKKAKESIIPPKETKHAKLRENAGA